MCHDHRILLACCYLPECLYLHSLVALQQAFILLSKQYMMLPHVSTGQSMLVAVHPDDSHT